MARCEKLLWQAICASRNTLTEASAFTIIFVRAVNPRGGINMGVTGITEKEMQSVKMSTLYELRLLFTQGDKRSTQQMRSWNF